VRVCLAGAGTARGKDAQRERVWVGSQSRNFRERHGERKREEGRRKKRQKYKTNQAQKTNMTTKKTEEVRKKEMLCACVAFILYIVLLMW